jgi:4-diphosphocytidyl-2-C-methyl-D-erythritol kinase
MVKDLLLWPAPAKLNLMLNITAQREDGYHELQTLFQFLDYGDLLEFSLRDDGKIHRLSGNEAIKADEDIVILAARALQQECSVSSGADISVQKKLPVGAGLGGGSSDAATTLHALNQLWGLGLETPQLAELGLTLGADVPVFVHGFSAFAEGVGEHLQKVELEQPWYLVITPHVHVSTAEIFAISELTRDCPAIKIADLLGGSWQNVCTPVVVKRYPEVAEALKALGEYSESRMSGTGSSVFTQFEQYADAEDVLNKLTAAQLKNNWSMFIAKGLNESPLVTFLNEYRERIED